MKKLIPIFVIIPSCGQSPSIVRQIQDNQAKADSCRAVVDKMTAEQVRQSSGKETLYYLSLYTMRVDSLKELIK